VKLAATAILAWLAFAATMFAAWLTHVILCLNTGQ
jgi:hypothetical protein